MEISDLIQILILFVLVVTAYISLKTIKETKNIHEKTLIWNKKNKTIDVINEFRDISIKETRKACFEKYKYNSEIPLEIIEKEIKNNNILKSEIINYLNHHEGIAIGIKIGLYDEDIVRNARKASFCSVYNRFIHFIAIERNKDENLSWWNEFEKLVQKWNNEV